MKNLIFVIALLTASAILSNSATAASMVYGLGNTSCGKYLSKKDDAAWLNEYHSWSMGALSVFMYYNDLRDVDAEGFLAGVDKHCVENPLDGYHIAVHTIVLQLKK